MEGEGLVTRKSLQQTDKKSNGKSKSNNKIVICFECHKKVHYRRDCSKLRKGKEVLVNITVNSPLFIDSSEGADSSTREVLSVGTHYEGDSWIIDSVATFHICPHKTLFVGYMYTSAKVYLRDGRSSSMDGIETSV